MGKTIKKNQTPKNRVRSVYGGSYVVRGQRYDVNNASSDTIAQDMAERGYRTGATARWNGRAYRLTKDAFGEFSLEHVA